VWLSPEIVVLTVVQAGCVALPAAGLPRWAERFRGPAWALVLPLSIAVVVAAIAAIPSTADVLTWVALVLVPIGGALAFGWAMRGARPRLAALALPLLVIAWALPDSRFGELAAVALIASSAITAGRLLAGAAPLTLLKAGVIAMAAVDAALVFSGNLQHPNEVLVMATPGGGLPQLQSASFAGAGMGYGDFLAAAVVGAILAAERRSGPSFALLMLVVALCWDQLLLVYEVLPATVPPALALIAAWAWSRLRATAGAGRARPRLSNAPPAAGLSE
jgi:hypothetical protein